MYASHVRNDFREVMSELERETGASREDLKAIGDVLRRDIKTVTDEVDKAGREVRDAADLEKAAGGNVIPFSATNGQGEVDSTAIKEAAMNAAADEPAPAPEPAAQAAEQPSDEEWFKPTPSRRRRAGSDST
jgi:hypothetical protein